MKTALQYKRSTAILFLTTVLSVAILVPFTLKNSAIHLSTADAAVFLYDPLGWLRDSLVALLVLLTGVLVKIVFFITKLSSDLFTLAADYSTRGSLYADLPFINTIWIFVRDLINAMFIFVVLFIALKDLLTFGSPNITKLKSTIVGIIVAALLINFSLFFTKIAIDASNYLTRTLICRMQIIDTSVNPPLRTCDPGEVLLAGLNLHTFDFGKLESYTNVDESIKAGKYLDQGVETLLVHMGGIVVGLVATLAFFSTAFMFIARIFILIILMATSPIMFISLVLNAKQATGYRAQWISTLESQLVFPIVFMLVLYLATLFISRGGFLPAAGTNTGGSLSFAEVVVGTPDAFPILLHFGFIIVLMFGGLKAARKVGGTAEIYGNKLSSFVANKALGTAGALGRQTAGRFAKNLAENDKLKAWSQKSAFNRFVGDKVMRGAGKVSESSFDARNSKMFGASYGTVGKSMGVGFDKGSDKTFKKDGKSIAAMGPGWVRQGSANLGFKMSKSEEEALTKAKSAKILEKHGYSGEMLAAYAQSEFGDKLMGKEHKDLREEIVKKIRDENKKDPAKAAEALKRAFGETGTGADKKNNFATDKEFKTVRQELAKDVLEKLKEDPSNKDNHQGMQDSLASIFGQDEYYKSKDFEEIRGQIAGEISKEKLKGTIKGYTDKYDELADIEKSISTGTHTSSALVDLETKREALKTELSKKGEEFQKASLNAKPEIVADLAAKDIGKLHSQLNKAHLMAIQKKRASPGGYAGSEQDIDEMIQKMLLDENNENPLLREQITAELIKDTSPFSIDLMSVYQKEIMNAHTAPTVDERNAAVKQYTRALGAMRTSDILKFEPSALLDPKVLGDIRPQAILEYRKTWEARDKKDVIADMEKIAASIDSALPHVKDTNQRNKIRDALLGKGGQGSGKGKNRKNRTP